MKETALSLKYFKSYCTFTRIKRLFSWTNRISLIIYNYALIEFLIQFETSKINNYCFSEDTQNELISLIYKMILSGNLSDINCAKYTSVNGLLVVWV